MELFCKRIYAKVFHQNLKFKTSLKDLGKFLYSHDNATTESTSNENKRNISIIKLEEFCVLPL